MTIRCDHKHAHGIAYCLYRCPIDERRDAFSVQAVDPREGLPPAAPDVVDVVALDLHKGWPNLGFDSILFAVRDLVCDLLPLLAERTLQVRVLTVDVRGEVWVPEHEPGRRALYVGSGGPGHIDPALNDGCGEVSQGVVDDPSWLPPLHRLYDAILADEEAALIAICHSFGLLYRHAAGARVAVRGPEKGGKSSGRKEIVLSEEGRAHPWFSRLQSGAGARSFCALDNRLCDLLPGPPREGGPAILAHETLEATGERGEAVTLVEFARDRDGVMPRVHGTNFHPEVVGRDRFRIVLEQKRASGRTTDQWYRERLELWKEAFPLEGDDGPLLRTSDLTFLGPLRFHLYRRIRERLQAMGQDAGPLHEDRIVALTR